jgi:hypothetical protein
VTRKKTDISDNANLAEGDDILAPDLITNETAGLMYAGT